MMYQSCGAMKHDYVDAAFIIVSKPGSVWFLQVSKEAHTSVVPPNN